MATTATVLNITPIIVPLIGPAPLQDLWNTLIPQFESIHSVFATTIAAAAAGEDQSFKVTCTLPGGFAYALVDWSMHMVEAEVGDVDDWDSNAKLFLRDGTTGATSKWTMDQGASRVVYHTNATLDAATYKMFNPSPLQKLIIPSAADGAQLKFNTFNVTIDGGPITVDWFSRFLVYDLNQAYRAIVNTPVPVR